MCFSIHTDAQYFSTEAISKEEGLSYNGQWGRRSILEDRFGYVWIATLNGLNRYDGYEVKQYLSSADNERYSAPFQGISSIAEDAEGNIWAGSQHKGIFKYNSKLDCIETPKFSYAGTELKTTQINALFTDKNYLYISAPWEGVFKVNLETNIAEQLNISQEVKETRIDIFNFSRSSKGEIIMIATDGVYVEKTNEILHHPIPFEYEPNTFTEVNNNKVLINSRKRKLTLLLDLETGGTTKFESENEIFTYHHFLDSKDNLWISNADAKFWMAPFNDNNELEYNGKRENIDEQNSFYVLDMIEHSTGDLFYHSMMSGVGKIKEKNEAFNFMYKGFYDGFGLLDEGVYFWTWDRLYSLKNTIVKELPHRIPAKTYLKNVSFLNDESAFFNIQDFEAIHTKTIKYDEKARTIKTVNSRLIQKYVPYSNGKVLIDTKKHDPDEELEFIGDIYDKLSPTPFDEKGIADFIVLENNDIWFASFTKGLYKITDNLTKLERIEHDPEGNGKLSNEIVKFLHLSKSGNILCYTPKGINIWDAKAEKFSYVGLEDGLNVHEIIGFVEDEDSVLWFISANQLYSYELNSKKLKAYPLPKEYRAKITKMSGFQTSIYTKGSKILYAGIHGIVELDTKILQKQSPPSDPLITDIYVDRNKVYVQDSTAILDSSLLYQKSFDLNWNQRNVGFKFVSVTGKDANANYAYRLIGYEDAWKNVGQERNIYFTNLDPGDYSFEVQVISSAGVASEKISSVDFEVHPPWYRTWLAYFIYSLIFLSALIFFVRKRIAKALRKIKELEIIRTKISSDLHDDVGTILSGIAMQAEMLSLNANNPDREELISLTTDTRDAMEKMRDIVWALDSRKDKYENLIDKMMSYAENKVHGSQFKFNFDLNDIPGGQMINPDVRQNIYLIFKEALTNIMKHSNGDLVTVKLLKQGKNILFSIKDNGNNTEIAKSEGLGLSNMKMRAERIGAQFFLKTNDGFEVGILMSPS